MAKQQIRMGKLGKPKGRALDPVAQAEVLSLLGDEPRTADLLIEHLHKIQDYYGHITAHHLAALAAEMKLSQAEVFEVASFYHHFDVVKEGQTPPPPLTVRVCESLSCALAGSAGLIKSLTEGLGPDVRVQTVPCVGRCAQAPLAVVGQRPIDHADLPAVQQTIEQRNTDPVIGAYIGLAEYTAAGGYQLYRDCLAGRHTAEALIATMENSGLRGLGGAGFPVGRKWRIVAEQAGPRLIAVNIDESEPGTFKDRHYLERDPHRFLEGMLLAAWAVGVAQAYIYLRDEYAGCRQILQREIRLLQECGLYPLPEIHLRRGAGAYICGEESAMIASIEGKRGLPRLRPPFVAQVGLFGQPTLVQNMESFYWVRELIERGPAWFAGHGRNGRQGLRSFSISGRVNKPGVHLAPAGITVRQLIAEYCDGMQDGHEFYGYFPGGAAGGMLPASLGDLPLDFDTLNPHGCFIGSAAIIVFSRHDRARDLALNAMQFFAEESCGQCTPCRVGAIKAADLMAKAEWDQSLLSELAGVMSDASICGLGQAAPNPLRGAMKYFPQEFTSAQEAEHERN